MDVGCCGRQRTKEKRYDNEEKETDEKWKEKRKGKEYAIRL